jgi:predicted DCC family thiol-disulfide oxidoreductase YuxK
MQQTSGENSAVSTSQSVDQPPASGARPLLVYDGACEFCAYWAHYWEKLTGGGVDYKLYQDVAARYPDIPLTDFQRAVQYLAPDGSRAGGAEASFLTLSHAPGKTIWLALYRHLPGFAALSEMAYAFIAAHRPAFYRISLCLWGKGYAPSRYELASSLFQRLLGLIFLSAFISFGVQAQGLIGSHGILPLADFVGGMSDYDSLERFFQMPMLFWWVTSDFTIQAICWAGAGASLCLVFDVFPSLALFLLYFLYLSLTYAGQVFMNYQWDSYLLETGFLALVLNFARLPGIWLLRWLLFRFMFMSGMVKLLSGDPNWWNLSALSYHFLTQPLPTPLAWYAAQLPSPILKFAVGCTFFIELVLPFLIFTPRRMRFAAGFGILLLQGVILLTGNYNWFNLQAMLLCLLLFDDAVLLKMVPAGLARLLSAAGKIPRPSRPRRIVVAALAMVIVCSSLLEMDRRFGGALPDIAEKLDSVVEPWRIANGYGLFAVMTTSREEVIIEGSYDNITWREYEFRYKPGDIRRAPSWNILHQPRLDWEMWFAALDDPLRLQWFWNFIQRLLVNEPAVTGLLEKNPFPDRPPNFVRAQLYDYTYSSHAEKTMGIWWDRRLLGTYFQTTARAK